jgi:cytoskeletal protein CcmA (bactofilin family)
MARNDVRIDTIVGKDTVFVGNIESSGSIRVEGRFEGQLITEGDLIIGESGSVQGKVGAKNVTIAGYLNGEIDARGKLELLPTATVQGDAQMMFLVVEEGASFQGQCAQIARGDLKERGKSLQVGTVDE